MKVGIDASNLREGGGRTHLIELLRHASPTEDRLQRVVVWGAKATLARLPTQPWLELRHEAMLDGPLPSRVAWQLGRLPLLARGVDVLFAPGGITTQAFHPRVVMSRNMLTFDARQRKRYGLSSMRIRLELLRRVQRRNFVTADGVIFLSAYARAEVGRDLARAPRRTAVIPHGVSERFRAAPRGQRRREEIDEQRPLRALYVSAVGPYKNHVTLVRAVTSLRREIPIDLTLIGPPDGSSAVLELESELKRVDPNGYFVRHLGKVDFDSVHARYQESELFVFASSCENMPNVLVEAMSSGLPIACSSREPMPEVLGNGGIFFDPEDVHDTALALRRLANDSELRFELATKAFERARAFTWARTARSTFRFLREVRDDWGRRNLR